MVRRGGLFRTAYIRLGLLGSDISSKVSFIKLVRLG